jgi:Flp pilus assembly protein TadG
MRGSSFLAGIAADCRGAAAIEFAVIALPLFMMLFGMIETGIMAFTSSVLEAATREAARQVRTGVVQGAADAASRFRTEFCPHLPATMACSRFYFDIRTFADFAAITLPPVSFDADGVPQGLQFAPGGANSVIAVRVIHPYRFMTPWVGQLMGGADNTVPLIATAVMRAEPYQ